MVSEDDDDDDDDDEVSPTVSVVVLYKPLHTGKFLYIITLLALLAEIVLGFLIGMYTALNNKNLNIILIIKSALQNKPHLKI